MKTSKLARLFIDFPLIKGDKIKLSKEDTHYLIKVMRKKQGNEVLIFNGIDGEWRSTLKIVEKNSVTLEITDQNRVQDEHNQVWLIFSPIKSPRLNFLIEKATELGVAGFIPVITDHTVVDKINFDKIKLWIKEASEQSERISVPRLESAISFKAFIKHWPKERKIVLCDETEKSKRITEAFQEIEPGKNFAIMIGPEGGFSDSERQVLQNLPYVISAQIGPRILRSETAPLAALSSFQCNFGDWNKGPRTN